jgi:flagellar basal body-associated protein FliL
MSESNEKNSMGAGAWIAIIVGGLIALALLAGCLGFFLYGARSTASFTPSSSPPPSAPTPAPAPAPTGR